MNSLCFSSTREVSIFILALLNYIRRDQYKLYICNSVGIRSIKAQALPIDARIQKINLIPMPF